MSVGACQEMSVLYRDISLVGYDRIADSFMNNCESWDRIMKTKWQYVKVKRSSLVYAEQLTGWHDSPKYRHWAPGLWHPSLDFAPDCKTPTLSSCQYPVGSIFFEARERYNVQNTNVSKDAKDGMILCEGRQLKL